MIRYAVSAGLVAGMLAAVPSGAQAETDNFALAVQQLPGIVESAMQQTGVPGVAVAVVHNDQVIYSQGFGVRSTKTNEPVTTDTVFQLASVSKPLGATVVAAAVGDKDLKWTDPITKFLPKFTLANTYVTKNVTVADMYSHRSGLPGSVGNDLELYGFGRKAIIKRMRYEPLSPFRVTYSYSNFGMTVGGQAAAESADTTWPKLAQKKIFGPLGMDNTSYRYKDFTKRSNRASLHQKIDGQWDPAEIRDADAQAPAGGASSTVLDMAKWLRLQLANGVFNGERVVKKGPLQEARSIQINNRPTSDDATMVGGYALGLDTRSSASGNVHWTHSGAFTAGAATTILMIPALNTGIVVLTNTWPIGVPEAIAASYMDIVETGAVTRDWLAFTESAFAPFTTPNNTVDGKPKPANPKPAKALKTYTGTYRNDYVGEVKIVKDGKKLKMRIGPGLETKVPLFHWTANSYGYTSIDMPKGFTGGAIFQKVKAGKAQQLYLDEVGPDVGVLTRE